VEGFIDRHWTIEDFEVAAKIEVAVAMVESVTKKNLQQVVPTCPVGKGLVWVGNCWPAPVPIPTLTHDPAGYVNLCTSLLAAQLTFFLNGYSRLNKICTITKIIM
jgi:hypothetical protein